MNCDHVRRRRPERAQDRDRVALLVHEGAHARRNADAAEQQRRQTDEAEIASQVPEGLGELLLIGCESLGPDPGSLEPVLVLLIPGVRDAVGQLEITQMGHEAPDLQEPRPV